MARFGRRVLERLMRYYRFVSESAARAPIKTLTSAQIAEALDIDATQIRKDFAAVGLLGLGRVGFDVCEVCRAIRVALGFDQLHEAVLVGAGHLGGALLAYSGFATYGLHITAAFDQDPSKVGTSIAGCTVRPMRTLKPFIRRHQIPLAILTTPAEASQVVADRVVDAGVKAIWNFSPTQLVAPKRVLVRHEHISLGMSVLGYHLKRSAGRARPNTLHRGDATGRCRLERVGGRAAQSTDTRGRQRGARRKAGSRSRVPATVNAARR